MEKKFKQTEIGLIPEDWEVKKLGEVAEVVGGGTPRTNHKEYWDGDINWFTPTEIGEKKYSYESKRKITKDGLLKSSARILPIGAILLTSRATIGEASILKKESTTNQGFQSLIPKNVCNEFLYYLVLILKPEIIKLSKGSTFLEVSPSNLKKILIPLPPTLAEQTAIATVLSDTDALIEKLEQLIAKKRNIKTGAMQELLKPKEGWEVKTLGEIATFKNGNSYESNIVDNGEYNLITLNSIDINGKLKGEHLKINKFDNSLAKGDLIMILSDVAHGNFLGLTAIIPENNKYVLNQRVGAIRNINYVTPYFLNIFININQKYFKLNGQGSSQLNLGKESILNFQVFYPGWDEQNKICSILSDMDAEIEALEKQLKKYKMLKQGMMQVLLTGKVRLI